MAKKSEGKSGAGRGKKVQAEGEPIEQLGRDDRTDGPSPLTDVDRLALGDAKSEWQERSAPAAGDPLTAAELVNLVVTFRFGSPASSCAIPRPMSNTPVNEHDEISKAVSIGEPAVEVIDPEVAEPAPVSAEQKA